MAFKNPFNFIRKANRAFNLFLENFKRIDDSLNAQFKNQEKLDLFMMRYGEDQKNINARLTNYDATLSTYNALLSALLDVYGENQKKTDDFLDSYNSVKDDLKKAVENFNTNYYSLKEYFFNGEEHLYKNMDTDEFFQMCFFNHIKLLSYSPSENRFLLETEDGIKLITNNRFYTIDEVFARNGYSTPQLHQFKEFVVFDIGMNRGYASLKFANFKSCKSVYGFEIDDDTYNFALENFNVNPSLSHKIKPYNFGLSNKNAEVDIYCLPGTDGVTTTELEFTNVQYDWVIKKDQMEIKKAQVKDAGHVISNIIEDDKINSPIILKIDTEGSEYKIIDSLKKSGVLNGVDLIMGESHLESEDLDDKFVGFKNISKVYLNNVAYSFIYVKDKFYNPLPMKIDNFNR
jgi:FkbM family methyltransferase